MSQMSFYQASQYKLYAASLQLSHLPMKIYI